MSACEIAVSAQALPFHRLAGLFPSTDLLPLATAPAHKTPEPKQEAATCISFDPAPGQIFCKCGAELGPFSFQNGPDGALITCRACHTELAQINADLERS